MTQPRHGQKSGIKCPSQGGTFENELQVINVKMNQEIPHHRLGECSGFYQCPSIREFPISCRFFGPSQGRAVQFFKSPKDPEIR